MQFPVHNGVITYNGRARLVKSPMAVCKYNIHLKRQHDKICEISVKNRKF